MDRRNALSVLIQVFGLTISSSALLSMVGGCQGLQSNNINYKKDFISNNKLFLNGLIDAILPSTNTLGAVDINALKFVDEMLMATLSESRVLEFEAGFKLVHKVFMARQLSYSSIEAYQSLLSLYFDLPHDHKQMISRLLESKVDVLSQARKRVYYSYTFLLILRKFTLLAYYTSDVIAQSQEIYNPITEMHEPCIFVDD